MELDYETLKLIWWGFVGLLLVGFAITDGFDMGVGTLLPFLGKTDEERRVIINAVGPTWEGNQTWLITAGGATFAAWPLVYATAFSGFYAALILALFALFFRPVGFDYRSKIEDPRWRGAWDWGLFIGGTVPPVIFGVAFGNLLQGVPFHFDAETMGVTYTGSFWQLLNPFGLLAGVISLVMLTFHGAAFLQLRTVGAVQARAIDAIALSGKILLVALALAAVWSTFLLDGYRITSMPPADTAFMPLAKTVVRESGAWIGNYLAHPWMLIAPLMAFGGTFGAMRASADERPVAAFILSSAAVGGVVLTAGFSLFPFVMPSSTDLNSSLTAWDAVSSHHTLKIMFWATIFFLPLIVLYTSWVYRVMRGKVTVESIRATTHTSY